MATIKEFQNELKESLSNNIVTKDGELIELHEKTIETISKELLLLVGNKNKEDIEQQQKGIEIRKEITEFEQTINNKLGNFYFNFYNEFPNIDRRYLFRFIYLCCFLKYEDSRICKKINETRYQIIKESELQELLKLQRAEYFRTKKSLIDNNLILINEDESISINNKVSFVGKVGRNSKDYVKIFKDGIIDLYSNSLPREHKKLALFIQLLPAIHFKFNVICKNPNCELMEDIIPYDLKELTEIFQTYNKTNIGKFKKQLLDTMVKGQNAMLMIDEYDKRFFIVNPLIYYRGNRTTDINYLINLFTI